MGQLVKALYDRLADRRTAIIALVVCGVVALAADSIWSLPLWGWEIAFGAMFLVTLPLVVNDFRSKRAVRGQRYVIQTALGWAALIALLVVGWFLPADAGLRRAWLALLGLGVLLVVNALRQALRRCR